MTEQETVTWTKLLKHIYPTDAEAIRVCLIVLDYVHLWDDLEDEGGVPSDQVNSVLYNALVELTCSPLWTPRAAVIFSSVFTQWQTANYFEAIGEHLDKALILRAGVYSLLVEIGKEKYGLDWASEASVYLWSNYGETVESLTKEFGHA